MFSGSYIRFIFGFIMALCCAAISLGAYGAITSELQKRAEQGEAMAQHRLGYLYHTGAAGRIDKAEAMIWYRKAADQGLAKSENAVARLLAFEDDAHQDYQAALPWLLKAEAPRVRHQGQGFAASQKIAKDYLYRMCRKGLVDFPQTHAYARDPKCLYARGKRLFYGRDKFGEWLADAKNYGIERDYVAARYVLEKALQAGEKRAALNLAKIYRSGLGTDKDDEKYLHYLEIAGETDEGEVHYVLAQQAKERGDIDTYISRLKRSAEDDYPRAATSLGTAYYKGEIVQQDMELAFMYFFLGGKKIYSRDITRRGPQLPFEKKDFIELFQKKATLELLEAAKAKSDNFAKTHEFKKRVNKDIDRSYARAISDYHWVQETGGEWHKDRGWLFYLFWIALLVTMGGIAFDRRSVSSTGPDDGLYRH